MDEADGLGPQPNPQRKDDAANDESFAGDSDGLAEVECLIHQLVDPPPEFPVKAAAIVGLDRALGDLTLLLPDVANLKQRVAVAANRAGPVDYQALSAEAAAAFTRRKKYHPHYLAALHAGLSSSPAFRADEPMMQPVRQRIGAWCLLFVLKGWRPTKHASAKVIGALSRPNSRTSVAWTLEQRQRAAADDVHALRIAIRKNPAAAAVFGLTSADVEVDSAATEIEEFNRRFRRRMSDLLEYKSADAQAGAAGHGALSSAGLKRAGRELLAGVRAGHHEEIHVSLEVLSHLTSDLVQLLPVQLGAFPPEDALAWLDVPGGAYNYVLFKLVDKGARPDHGTEPLYEVTTQVVRVDLSPPLADSLRKSAAVRSGEFCSIRQLLGDVGHGPHDAVAGEGRYQVTASKLQMSLPALLLQQGEFRWTTSLATSSPYLVSRGRPAYGMARQTDIDRVLDHMYDLQGWPRPSHDIDDGVMVGSFTTPRVLAVGLAFAALAREADASTMETGSLEDVICYVNAHAAYLAMLLALAFALRNRVVYKLPTPGLRARLPLKFCDKDVHEYSMPAVPMLQVVADALDGWERLLGRAVEALLRIGTPDALALADWIAARLRDHASDGWVFTITVAHTLEPVGVHAWRDRLPRGLRLVENFGRQFWPFRLALRGICQSDLDVLMRHQIPALHPGSSHVCLPEAEIHERLIAAMTAAIKQDLALAVPVALRASV